MAVLQAVELSVITLVAAAGGTIQIAAELDRVGLARIGLDAANGADVDVRAELVNLATGTVVQVAGVDLGVNLAPQPGTLGRTWLAALVIGAAAVAAGTYFLRVRVSDDLTPSSEAQALGFPASIDDASISPVSTFFTLT